MIMKKLFLITILLVLSLIIAKEASAENYILYSKGDLSIGFNDVSTCVLYDFKAKETKAGVKTSVIEWKKLNLDFGAIGDYDDFKEIDGFTGVSYDIPMFTYKENIYTGVGAFASPGWLDDEEESYGVYAELGLKFD
jgi:hypothetical protein